ncbi:MAG: MFS transporter, partial [Actinobacteria bacterium]|nr:MFS transporter [Actinomycetota bacterium]
MGRNRNNTLKLLFNIFIFFGIAYTVIDPLIPLISDKLNIGYDKIGLILFISSSFSLLSTFVSGKLSDKYNLKKIIFTGLFIIFTGFLIYGFYFSLVILILTVIFFRVGSGIIDSSIHTYVAKMFYREHSPIFVRLDFFWYIGAIIGPVVISLALFLKIDPKYIFFLFAAIAFIVLILFYKYCSDLRGCNDLRNLKSSKDSEIHNIFKESTRLSSISYHKIIRNPIIVLVCFGLFFYIGIFTVLSTWLTTYFAELNIPVSFGSTILSVFWAFNALGVFITGKIVSKTREVNLILIYSIVGGLSTIIYSLIPFVYVKIIFLIFQAIFYSSLFPLLTAVAAHENVESSGTILGFILSFSVTGLIVFQPLSGYMIEYF